VEYFKYRGSLKTIDARCIGEIKSGLPMAKATFKKNTFFYQKTGHIFMGGSEMLHFGYGLI
jgi:hypothetical protein